MFDGVPEQFHQFIASSRAVASLPLPTLSFPLHGSSQSFPSFVDPYTSHHQTVLHQQHQVQHQQQYPNFLQQLHHQSSTKHEEREEESGLLLSTNLQLERERSVPEKEPEPEPIIDPWPENEVLALLRIRSGIEGWLPDFTTWEHVSRKLAELGFKRSAEKCKQKFEEENRHFNNNITSSSSSSYNNKNYRLLSELEQLCHGNSDSTNPSHEEVSADDPDPKKNRNLENPDGAEDTVLTNPSHQETSTHEKTLMAVEKCKNSKKRKRREKEFEMLKCFCEDVVRKMIAQQEEWHSRLMEDMVKRDEEKIAREEAWKREEMERMSKEIEMRSHEQAIAGDRQAIIIEFLKKFTTSCSFQGEGHNDQDNLIPNLPPNSSSQEYPNPSTCREVISNNYQENPILEIPNSANVVSVQQENTKLPMNPISESLAPQNPNSNTQNPNSPNTQFINPSLPNSISPHQNPVVAPNEREDIGKRWPRDEVLALINLRCNFYNVNGEDKDGTKGPLWERISQGMLELGYKRSAKRCKEKWENINKYFRKTKDANKKRPLDSRTCPYFHQLNSLYSQGTLPSSAPAPETQSVLPENCPGDYQVIADIGTAKNVTQVAALDFEF